MGKRLGIYMVGLAIAALGIALIILSVLGAGPWDSVAVGLNQHLGLTIGTWSIICQVFFTLLTWIIEKTRFRIESILPIVIRSLFLDFWIYVVFAHVDLSSSWEVQWGSLILGIVIAGVGIGSYMEAQLPKTPIDSLMVAISEWLGWSFNRSRLCIEVSGAVIGFLLGGPIGVGTVLTALFLGKIIQMSNQKAKTLFQIQTNILETRS